MKPPCVSGFGVVQSIAGSVQAGALAEGEDGDDEVGLAAIEPEQLAMISRLQRASQRPMVG